MQTHVQSLHLRNSWSSFSQAFHSLIDPSATDDTVYVLQKQFWMIALRSLYAVVSQEMEIVEKEAACLFLTLVILNTFFFSLLGQLLKLSPDSRVKLAHIYPGTED